MTLAAAPEALQGAVAAGILGCGSVVLGSAESAARVLHDVVSPAPPAADLEDGGARRDRGAARGAPAIPGYGHPLHRGRRPARAAPARGRGGSRCRRPSHRGGARRSSVCCPSITGKSLVDERLGRHSRCAARCRLSGPGALKGVPILARTAGLFAHLLEEQYRPIGFVLAHSGAAGDRVRRRRAPAGFVPSDADACHAVLQRYPRRRAGHVHHRSLRRHDARGSRRRRHQGRKPGRRSVPQLPGQGQYSPHFQAYNRNKRSVVLDLKAAADREVFERLIREADVYIQNFRPGTADAPRRGRRAAAAV